MKIYAPVKDFTGLRNNVRFINGAGETNDSRVADWFRTHGYKVAIERIEQGEELLQKAVEQCDESEFVEINRLADEPDFEAMTPNELRDWAKAHGLGSVIKNIRNKERLLEIVRG